jgi:hypothetical protein
LPEGALDFFILCDWDKSSHPNLDTMAQKAGVNARIHWVRNWNEPCSREVMMFRSGKFGLFFTSVGFVMITMVMAWCAPLMCGKLGGTSRAAVDDRYDSVVNHLDVMCPVPRYLTELAKSPSCPAN